MRFLDEQYRRPPFYGSGSTQEWLATQGYEMNRKRVSLLMAVMGIEAVCPKPKLSRSEEGRRIATSMDGRERGVDNIFVERLWRSLKQEDRASS